MTEKKFELVRWDAISREIETAKDIEVLLNMKDKLRAYQVLAEQSRQSAEVQAKIAIYKARADRKCGEWLKENVKQGGEHGNQYKKVAKSQDVTLANIGVSKNESSRLQKIAAIPDKKFEAILLEAEIETKKITNNMLVKIAKEGERTQVKKAPIMPDGVFNVIYADPPWQYSNSGFSMSAAKQYPVMATNDICKMSLPEIGKNAVLFLWTTNPLLADAFQVAQAWGFEYKTNIAWIKKRHTAGFYVFGQHELLLICVKGSMLPDENGKIKSVVDGDNDIHSRKPEKFYSIIEKMYPSGKYIELFARNKRSGWISWGNQCD